MAELVPFLASSTGQHPYSKVPLTHEEQDDAMAGDMMFVFSVGSSSAKKLGGNLLRSFGTTEINASELKMSQTVMNHINDIIKSGPNKGELARPYIDSNGTTLLLDEIMNAQAPVKDTILKNGLKWNVGGSFRGSVGTWELVIDTSSNTVVHFNFVTK